MNFVEILKVIVLGIVEGFTEWLPISSTGHMILVDEIIHLDVSGAFREVFMVVIQLGAILAVLLLYFHKLNPFSQRKNPEEEGDDPSVEKDYCGLRPGGSGGPAVR